MDALAYGAAGAQGLADSSKAARTEAAVAVGEVRSGIANLHELLGSLGQAVARVFETFGPVIAELAEHPTDPRPPLSALASTSVGVTIADGNEQLERLTAAIHRACDGCRL